VARVVAIMAVGCGVLGWSASAFAVDSGYEGVTGASGVPGGFGSVLTTQPVAMTGGSVTATVGANTITVTVPSGALTEDSEVTITSGTASAIGNAGVSGDDAVIGIGINVTDTSGTKFTGTFGTPISVTISGTFNPADSVVLYDVTSSSWQTVSGASVTSGLVSFSISSDPDIAVLAPEAATSSVVDTPPVVAGATDVTTGKPFLLEGILAGALILTGTVAFLRLRRRKTSNRW
jgi:hypothetical protein